MKISEIKKRGFTKCGTYKIYFTGSKCSENRMVYRDNNNKYYCEWYGQIIEVARSRFGEYCSVESY